MWVHGGLGLNINNKALARHSSSPISWKSVKFDWAKNNLLPLSLLRSRFRFRSCNKVKTDESRSVQSTVVLVLIRIYYVS